MTRAGRALAFRTFAAGFALAASLALAGCQEMSNAMSEVSSAMGDIAGGSAGQLTQQMKPLQAKLNETLARVEKDYPGRKGMVVATFSCYVPGEIDATRLRGNETCQQLADSRATVRQGKKMLAVIPLALKQDFSGNRAFIGEVKPNALIEIVTIDYAIPDSSSQVYMFGDQRFDMAYVGKIAVFAALVALEQSRRSKDDYVGMIAGAAAATAGVAFVASLSDILVEMGKAGGAQGSDMMQRSTSALASR